MSTARKFCHIRQNFLLKLPSKPSPFGTTRFYRLDSNIFGCSSIQKTPSRHGTSDDLSAEFLKQTVEEKSLKALINAYRRFGYLQAQLDPLELTPLERVPELEPETYGFDEASLQKPLKEGGEATLADMVGQLRQLYAGPIAVEFMHLKDVGERQFFAKIFEDSFQQEIAPSERVEALKIMLKMKAWENFLALKFPQLKRYSGEGAESMAVFYRQLLEECPGNEISEFHWGGAHRGRLALQTMLFQFPAGQMFRKMRGKTELPDDVQGIGDVLTHQHSHFHYRTTGGQSVYVSTLSNPSHLEAAMPAVIGKARARAQTLRVGDYFVPFGMVGDAILPVHHHGDGAFTGQGVLWECLAISQVPNFRVGGSIHLIVNNQLAFTADKNIGRSTTHCTDVAKAIDCPVIHVNAEHIEKVILAAKIALAYRQEFRKEIFVNLVSYRRYGHNELDDPRFTQPKMYRAVDSKQCLVDKFADKLEADGLFTRAQCQEVMTECGEELKQELDKVDSGQTEPKVEHLGGLWHGFQQAPAAIAKWDTGLDTELLRFVGAKSLPPAGGFVREFDGFAVHPHLQKTHVDARLKRIATGQIDWSTAEAMAIGSALLQGISVRLSGQDVGRGTFSHRHAMAVCQQTDRAYIPLNKITEEQQAFLEIANSPLSEAAIVGFEYGFAIESPKRLVIWEAQFGDFYNGAQVQLDTMVASGESKWLLQNGLVLLLPHGFDGAGPDHSSAHIERFLQLTDSREDQCPPDGDNVNLQIANPTTSSQYFHLLRRQIVTPYRKPLVIIAPKILLRHSFTVSPISDFAPGTTFQPVLRDPRIKDPSKVSKLIFCSGKHVVTLMDEREKRCSSSPSSADDVAIVRLEGICPFPVEALSAAFTEYPNAKTFVWSQEEPQNAGCWSWVQPRFRNAFGVDLSYAGRPALAWMATPISEVHKKEIDQVIEATFNL